MKDVIAKTEALKWENKKVEKQTVKNKLAKE